MESISEERLSLAKQAIQDAWEKGIRKAGDFTDYGRERKIKRAEMRAARKALSMKSVQDGDEWYWVPPEEKYARK